MYLKCAANSIACYNLFLANPRHFLFKTTKSIEYGLCLKKQTIVAQVGFQEV